MTADAWTILRFQCDLDSSATRTATPAKQMRGQWSTWRFWVWWWRLTPFRAVPSLLSSLWGSTAPLSQVRQQQKQHCLHAADRRYEQTHQSAQQA